MIPAWAGKHHGPTNTHGLPRSVFVDKLEISSKIFYQKIHSIVPCPEIRKGVRFNTFQSSVTFHIENSHLICSANQMTGWMKYNNELEWTTFYWKKFCNFVTPKKIINITVHYCCKALYLDVWEGEVLGTSLPSITKNLLFNSGKHKVSSLSLNFKSVRKVSK